jgi:transcriptional regulator with XRE-family HTH domain
MTGTCRFSFARNPTGDADGVELGMVEKSKHSREALLEHWPWWSLRQAGLSLKEIAAECGVCTHTVSKWLRVIDRLDPAEREALAVERMVQPCHELVAWTQLGNPERAKAAKASMDHVTRARRSMEFLMKPKNETGAKAPRTTQTEDDAFAGLSTAELKSRLRDQLESQADRLGFGRELRDLRKARDDQRAQELLDDGREGPAAPRG